MASYCDNDFDGIESDNLKKRVTIKCKWLLTDQKESDVFQKYFKVPSSTLAIEPTIESYDDYILQHLSEFYLKESIAEVSFKTISKRLISYLFGIIHRGIGLLSLANKDNSQLLEKLNHFMIFKSYPELLLNELIAFKRELVILVCNLIHTKKEAIKCKKSNTIDLMLLDVYIDSQIRNELSVECGHQVTTSYYCFNLQYLSWKTIVNDIEDKNSKEDHAEAKPSDPDFVAAVEANKQNLKTLMCSVAVLQEPVFDKVHRRTFNMIDIRIDRINIIQQHFDKLSIVEKYYSIDIPVLFKEHFILNGFEYFVAQITTILDKLIVKFIDNYISLANSNVSAKQDVFRLKYFTNKNLLKKAIKFTFQRNGVYFWCSQMTQLLLELVNPIFIEFKLPSFLSFDQIMKTVNNFYFPVEKVKQINI